MDILLDSNIPVTPVNSTLDLLEEWDQIKVIDIKRHIKFLRRYGQQWDLQNLDWSLELIQSSCELGLKNKVQEKMIKLPHELESGPMFFYLMMREIISSTEASTLSMVNRIKTMKLSSFKGENVSVATGQLSMALRRLQVLDKVPVEIRKHILKGLQTSSVTAFNSYFSLLETNLDQIPNFTLTNDEILDKADGLYRELLEIGEWTSAKFTTPANAFVSEDSSKEPKCARCGKHHPGQPCSVVHWKFVPPSANDNDEKSIKGKTWYWCGKCRRWNPTHKTHQHVKRESTGPTANENLRKAPQTVAPGTVTPSTTSSSTEPTVAVSANIAQYDTSILNNCRRSFFRNQFRSIE